MLTVRIIPCLDVSAGRVVKGIKFQNLRDAGSPADLAEMYEHQGADEIVFLDISATDQGRNAQLETIKQVREKLSIPLTVGGGVRTLEDAQKLLEAGADKVAVNSAAVSNPHLISDIAKSCGSQCAILAIDAKTSDSESWQVVVRSGKIATGRDVVQWAKIGMECGAGEILLTSWDRDGTRSGYDLPLIQAVSKAVSVPIIASGGAAEPRHLLEAIQAGADAVLAASLFHDGDWTVASLKVFLASQNICVRVTDYPP